MLISVRGRQGVVIRRESSSGLVPCCCCKQGTLDWERTRTPLATNSDTPCIARRWCLRRRVHLQVFYYCDKPLYILPFQLRRDGRIGLEDSGNPVPGLVLLPKHIQPNPSARTRQVRLGECSVN